MRDALHFTSYVALYMTRHLLEEKYSCLEKSMDIDIPSSSNGIVLATFYHVIRNS